MSLLRILRSDFVAPYDERHLPAPGVDKGRPASVDGQIFPAAGAHPQGWILKRLPCKLKDWRETTEQTCMRKLRRDKDIWKIWKIIFILKYHNFSRSSDSIAQQIVNKVRRKKRNYLNVEIKTEKGNLPVYDECIKLRMSSLLNRLTLLMYSHHQGPVFRVDVEQGGGSHQVLRQVAQQWHCPANTIYFHNVR